MTTRPSPSAIVHALRGAPACPGCAPAAPFECWVCGARAERGIDRRRWLGVTFVGQNRVRAPDSMMVCEACAYVMAGRPPDTLRLTSHLYDDRGHLTPNKGAKPAILAWLREPKVGAWFAAIADSGKKHLIPWAPINAPGGGAGLALFEERIVEIGAWELVDAMTALLTAGASKEEIGRGEYGPRAWLRVGADALRGFERAWSGKRGSGWFELGLWLAQRQEVT